MPVLKQHRDSSNTAYSFVRIFGCNGEYFEKQRTKTALRLGSAVMTIWGANGSGFLVYGDQC